MELVLLIVELGVISLIRLKEKIEWEDYSAMREALRAYESQRRYEESLPVDEDRYDAEMRKWLDDTKAAARARQKRSKYENTD